jgi:FlaA1/EpsC-like NDP-sugar epimerase
MVEGRQTVAAEQERLSGAIPEDALLQLTRPAVLRQKLSLVMSGSQLLRSWRQSGVDIACWAVAIIIGCLLRFDFSPYRFWHAIDASGVLLLFGIAAGAQVLTGLIAGLYVGRWRYGSFDEVLALAAAGAGATAIVVALDQVLRTPHLVPIGAAVVAGGAATMMQGAARYTVRMTRELSKARSATGKRTLIFGGGEGGYRALMAMRWDPECPYMPVGILDDDPTKRHLRMLGVSVLGGREGIDQVARATQGEVLIIAVPSAGSELVSDIYDRCKKVGLRVKVLPSVSELYRDKVEIGDIRDVTEEDLLGRQQVAIDLDSIAHYLTGRKVLITGAGGSIGSELCRQVSRFGPSALIMVDRDESALHAVSLSLVGRALMDDPEQMLVDIRERRAVQWLFETTRPDVVFHAAALKHVPVLERHPGEALKTNVWGTRNVLEFAAAVGVERFVNISTDKAADPINVLGYSKRVAERLTAGFAGRGAYISVRFGNVLGSRGSMLETFRAQVEAGGPITVTDPDVTRYFMTIPEAVQLVIQAGAVGQPGEALVLDMGRPVRIEDVARRLVAQADRPIRVVYPRLRSGEKLHEVLFGKGERDDRPSHPLISHVVVPPLSADSVWDLDPTQDPTAVTAALQSMCCVPESTPVLR